METVNLRESVNHQIFNLFRGSVIWVEQFQVVQVGKTLKFGVS
jgi:hypothetical protein